MKTARVAMIQIGILLLAALPAWAQNATQPAPVPAKVTVVFKEYQGSKLISNLPYVLSVNARQEPISYRQESHLRVGLHVPINVGLHDWRYQDVGTDIDCGVEIEAAGRYLVQVSATRNSLRHPPTEQDRDQAGGALQQNRGRPEQLLSPSYAPPILNKSSIDEALLMRNGQTVQSLMATDPLSGRVLKVDVTLNVANQ